MLKIQEIRELIRLMDQSSVNELTYEEDGCKVKLKKNNGVSVSAVVPEVVQAPVAVPPVQAAPQVTQSAPKAEVKVEAAPVEVKEVSANVDDANLHKIVSPMVGTFYAAPSPEEADYVKVGDKVKANSVVCIVEAMKLFNEIEAEVEGEIVEVLVKNGQLVEYGQPLFLVKAE
ncbi:acetyl-CoA carboxylase biotin carboxyl carrier protein [Calidifontibacillus oryziterrae]|uniref:acetyl-CoA carboxylase biotin carboxyl carrier protein n=1 Tax=Calidifontibacillus oryziterrae TaxID=1191699 RepID=UPI00031D7176|nr:acetyl-CoA carboxylase biotin carboxyl carrier protein [Calidifontibacillus oryziterrae]